MKEQWKDRGLRHPVQLGARVIRSGGEDLPIQVSDLSLDGCCLDASFAIGERISLVLPRIGRLEAEIRWSFLDRSGARFIRGGGEGQ